MGEMLGTKKSWSFELSIWIKFSIKIWGIYVLIIYNIHSYSMIV